MSSSRIRSLPSEWVKINLGSNRNVLPGWINTDIYPFEGVDVVADLNQPWPWDDDYATYIRAYDLVEHLRSPAFTMNEAWRVLGHGGIFEIWVPSTDGRGAFQDPTHVSYWNFNSFQYYSKRNLASLYPGTIRCDYDIAWFDTRPTPDRVIWTWALCRAVKDPAKPPRLSDEWMTALSNPDQAKRVMPGYDGNTFGTIPLPG
jgi:SAM-dependent methyltransferase